MITKSKNWQGNLERKFTNSLTHEQPPINISLSLQWSPCTILAERGRPSGPFDTVGPSRGAVGQVVALLKENTIGERCQYAPVIRQLSTKTKTMGALGAHIFS